MKIMFLERYVTLCTWQAGVVGFKECMFLYRLGQVM